MSASGELTITAPNGEQVSGQVPTGDAAAQEEPANEEQLIDGDADMQ